MENNQQRIRSRKKEILYELLIRWWGAGAVYFFIGWGTQIGAQSSLFDLVFILGISCGFFTIVILDPLIYNVLDIERKNGSLYNKSYLERTIIQNVMLRSIEIIKGIVIVILIFFVTNMINIALIYILNLSESSVPLPGEPITFGLMYIGFYYLFRFFGSLIKTGDK